MHFSVSCRQIEALTVDVLSAPITVSKLAEVKTSLEEVPPVRFDLARPSCATAWRFRPAFRNLVAAKT